jgi:hypothetical protein
MPAKDFGTKYLCFKCNTKFYDLKKPDPICPKCGADQRDSAALKPAGEGRRSRLAAVPKIVEPIETPAVEKDGDELEIDDIDEDEDEDDDV